MTCYILSPVAEQDIEEVIFYLAKENVKAADKFIDSLYDAFEKLSENPEMGHWREDISNHSVRFWTFKWHYLIIYKPVKPLQIVRVLSGYRDIINLL